MNSSDDAWLDALLRLGDRGEPAVLVTVVAARGSAPREAGAKMVIARDTLAGTIGGGHLELQAIEIARGVLDALDASGGSAVRRFPLGAALGQCCGGAIDLLFDPVLPGAAWLRQVQEHGAAGRDCVIVSRAASGAACGKLVVCAGGSAGSLGDPALDARAAHEARSALAAGAASLHRVPGADESGATVLFVDPVRTPDLNVVLFGAGHVARALVQALTGVPCRITWVDERAAEFPVDVPSHACAVVTDSPAGSFFLVMTHSHALDQQLTERILRRDDFAYLGLIGSRTKRRLFERRLVARGIAADRFARLTCPIGVAGIGGKTPAVIALAVAAQLLQVREQRSQQYHETGRRAGEGH